MLTEIECERIAGAIRDSESRTAGEIVVVVAAQSSAYRSIALLYALLGALVTPWPLIWATSFSVSRIAMVQLGIALALTLILSQLKLRFALVPNAVKRARCRERTARQFAARGARPHPGSHGRAAVRLGGGALRRSRGGRGHRGSRR